MGARRTKLIAGLVRNAQTKQAKEGEEKAFLSKSLILYGGIHSHFLDSHGWEID